MNYPGLSEWALNANLNVSLREAEGDQVHRGEGDVKMEQRCDCKPRNADSHQKQGEARTDFPLEPLEGAWPLVLDIWAAESRENKFLMG